MNKKKSLSLFAITVFMVCTIVGMNSVYAWVPIRRGGKGWC